LWNGHPHFPACVTLDVDSGQKGMNDNANSRIGRTRNSRPFLCVINSGKTVCIVLLLFF
jgi:hypothetical protein